MAMSSNSRVSAPPAGYKGAYQWYRQVTVLFYPFHYDSQPVKSFYFFLFT